MKINLADLDKLLFPETYPFNREGFSEELNLLHGTDDQNLLSAIAFKIKLTKLSMKIKPEMRETIHYIYEDFMGRNYEWNRTYECRELMLVLSFFVLFWDVKTIQELEERINDPVTIAILKKYKPQFSKLTGSVGSIENPVINNHIVNILEGKMKAFDNRRIKYRE